MIMSLLESLFSCKVESDNLDCFDLNYLIKINSFSLLLFTGGRIKLNIDFQEYTLHQNYVKVNFWQFQAEMTGLLFHVNRQTETMQ